MPFTFDVFLSHSSKDKDAVRDLATRLKADGLRVWFDEWEVLPGDSILLKIEEGLEQSRVLILIMSANAFASDWVTLERHTTMFRDPTNAQRRFIPLRLDDEPISDILRQFAYVDWRERAKDEYEKLVRACEREEETENVESPNPRNLTNILEGHTGAVNPVAITADGTRAISGSADQTVRVWDLTTQTCVAVLQGHTESVWGAALTPDGTRAISGSADQTVRVWNLTTQTCVAVLQGHTQTVSSVTITPDGTRAISGNFDQTVRVWDLTTQTCVAVLQGHTSSVFSVALTPDGTRAISGSADQTVRVWDLTTQTCVAVLQDHTESVLGVALTPDGTRAISGSADQTVRVWDLTTQTCVAVLQGHTESVWGAALTPDGTRAISGSDDNTTRVWDLTTSTCTAVLEGHTGRVWSVALTPDGTCAISGSADKTVHIWDLPSLATQTPQPIEADIYTNAKVLLVGDSGVGKSGLAIRLTADRFEETISTDAAWATQMQLPHDERDSNTQREIWLWDFAGQADYRLIHQLYFDETALAVFVFNPQHENPFEGLGQWDRELRRAARRPFAKLLVAGRCDRGGLMVSQAAVEQFLQERGFSGYLETSASTGAGCQELREAIIQNIAWDMIPWRASPRIFKLLKAEIIKLKDQGIALLRMSELQQHLQMRLVDETFTPEQLRAVVALLAGPGIVWQLEFGDFVLLQPERINAYAAAVVRSVRAHTDEIGCIAEERILSGDIDYQDLKRLPKSEEQVVLRAMYQTFVDHGLCLREHTDAGTLLVFPSYFKRERPPLEDHPAGFVTYHFSGPVDEIYATLVVRLHHTSTFEKDCLWRFAADFKTFTGQRIGLKLVKLPEGAASLTVYVDPKMSADTKAIFIRYVHNHLNAKTDDVQRDRHYVCQECGTPVENRQAVQARLARGLKDIVCANCEQRVNLWDLIEEKFASRELQQWVRNLDQQARISIDNESRELILVGHAFAIAGEAGQIFRQVSNSDWGIDGEIEFKNQQGEASGKRVYLQLKSGDSYLSVRKLDDKHIFTIPSTRHSDYWQAQAYPVMLVIRTSNSEIRWMNATEYLRKNPAARQIVFDGEPFTALNVARLRDRLFPLQG